MNIKLNYYGTQIDYWNSNRHSDYKHFFGKDPKNLILNHSDRKKLNLYLDFLIDELNRVQQRTGKWTYFYYSNHNSIRAITSGEQTRKNVAERLYTEWIERLREDILNIRNARTWFNREFSDKKWVVNYDVFSVASELSNKPRTHISKAFQTARNTSKLFNASNTEGRPGGGYFVTYLLDDLEHFIKLLKEETIDHSENTLSKGNVIKLLESKLVA